MTLREYVLRRNGVPLGGRGALQAMLSQALGAPTFATFWQYWNPIWGYYLARFVYQPLRRLRLGASVAVLVTFFVSGALHDVAAMLVARQPVVVCTPWFFLLGAGVLVGKALGWNTSGYAWGVRALVNVAYVVVCLIPALVFFRV